MKVTCILASYNRPNFVRHSLRSVADQDHKNYELLVFDDSTVLDIHAIVREFAFPSVKVFHMDVGPERRRSQGRLGINCNAGLSIATGDLICYLCDDDYYYPGWFKAASCFFSKSENLGKNVAFGRLMYSDLSDMVYPSHGPSLMHQHPIDKPFAALDHNQVVHRRFSPPFRWPEDFANSCGPDAVYFNEIAKAGNLFFPIDCHAVVKRRHSKAYGGAGGGFHKMGTPEGEGLRE